MSKGKVSRIRGFVARSSRTAAGGTSSLFNHANRSHPTLLTALRELIGREMPPIRTRPVSAGAGAGAGALRIAAGRAGKRRTGRKPIGRTSVNAGSNAGGRLLHHPHAQQHPPMPAMARPPPSVLRIAAVSACGLLPPGVLMAPWPRQLLKDPSEVVSRVEMVGSAWPFLREEIKIRLSSRLSSIVGISLTMDEWLVSGRDHGLFALQAHFIDADWKRRVINLGVINPVLRPDDTCSVLDARPVLDAFGLQDLVFGVVTGGCGGAVDTTDGDVEVVVDGQVSDLVGDCFRGRCLFSSVMMAGTKLCGGAFGDPSFIRDHLGDCSGERLVIHGEGEATVKTTVGVVAKCIAAIRENAAAAGDVGRVSSVHAADGSAGDIGHHSLADVTADGAAGTGHVSGGLHVGTGPSVSVGMPMVNGVGGASSSSVVVGPIQDVMTDGGGCDGSLVSTAAAARAAAVVAAATEIPPTPLPTLPKPYLKGNFLSLLTEWETLCGVNEPVNGFTEELLKPMREMLSDENWVIIRAVTRALSLVRNCLSNKEGWCMLPDALMQIINLVCAICDRLTVIEMLLDQPMDRSGQYSSMRMYMTEFVRRHQIRPEDADGSTEIAVILEGYLLNNLLIDLYPVIQPLTEYVPKQSYFIMALALDPRYGSLASLISLNKKLMHGSRLMFEKEYHNEDNGMSDERIRKQVLSILSRYDHEVIIPIMLAVNSKYNNSQSEEGAAAKVGGESEEGLFAETFEPTDDWKNRQQLDTELTKFRAYKKNILRSANAADCLSWWENNAELFPNISSLFKRVVSIPSSHVPVQRILSSAGAKMKVARRRIGRAGLEDLIFIHENLTTDMLSDIQGMPRFKTEVGEGCQGAALFDDDSLLEIAPEFFSCK